MKKFLILVLLIALCAAAFLSKPKDPKASFTDYLADKVAKKDPIFPASWDAGAVSLIADQCEYKDRLLWVDVKHNDKTIYTNVFSHWLDRAELKSEFQNGVEKTKDKIDHAADKLAGKS